MVANDVGVSVPLVMRGRSAMNLMAKGKHNPET